MFSAYISSSAYYMLSSWINDKREKNVIIDPLTCIIKLGVLSFKDLGTKVSVSHNSINFYQPSLLQGTWRFLNRDNREDLHNLYNPIIKAISWYLNDNSLEDFSDSLDNSDNSDNSLDISVENSYDNNDESNESNNNNNNNDNNGNMNVITQIQENDTNQIESSPVHHQIIIGDKNMTYLFSLAVNGLELLKKAYSNNSTICHTLNYYIELIKNRGANAIPQKKNTNQDFENQIHNKLHNLWSMREIRIVIELFKEHQYKKDDDIEKKHILETIEKMSEMKEKKVTELIEKIATIL
tara:strand:+ start:944 stop:1831 length:888 start_codon:yes stop_codon:yes gene_type:complete